MVHIDGSLYGVAKCHIRIEFLILEGSFIAVFVRSKSVIVSAWGSEGEISELQHSFKVFRRTATGYVLCLIADTVVDGCFLSG